MVLDSSLVPARERRTNPLPRKSPPLRSRDTDPAAEQVQLELLRGATVARRASLALSLSSTAMLLSRRAIQESEPNADADELAARFVAICYGRELADGLHRHLRALRTRRRGESERA